MIQQARIYDLKKLSHEQQRAEYGVRVLTTRKWLQGISKNDIDIWLPEAGPSLVLLSAWRAQEITWETFVDHYKDEQQTLRECRPSHYVHLVSGAFAKRFTIHVSPIQYLASLSMTALVTVLCWEQGEQCHRHTLVDLVRGEI